jgi:hypothetical protein
LFPRFSLPKATPDNVLGLAVISKEPGPGKLFATKLARLLEPILVAEGTAIIDSIL